MDPDRDPALFGSGFQDANKKISFIFRHFVLISYCRYINIVLRKPVDEKSQNNRFVWLLLEGSGSVQIITGPVLDLRGPKTYRSGSYTLLGGAFLLLTAAAVGSNSRKLLQEGGNNLVFISLI
jgi:hypothetical protein